MELLDIILLRSRQPELIEIAVVLFAIAVGIFLGKKTGTNNDAIEKKYKALLKENRQLLEKVENLEGIIEKINENNLCGNYEGTVETMSLRTIKGMIKNYRRIQLDASNQRMSRSGIGDDSDTKAVKFSIERLKEFIHHTEKTVQNHFNASQMPELGIRFYFASYPCNKDNEGKQTDEFEEFYRQNDFSTNQQDPNYLDPRCEGRQTLVMVPTYKNGSEHIDFDVNDRNLLGDTFIDILNQSTNVEISAANHGTLFPPMD